MQSSIEKLFTHYDLHFIRQDFLLADYPSLKHWDFFMEDLDFFNAFMLHIKDKYGVGMSYDWLLQFWDRYSCETLECGYCHRSKNYKKWFEAFLLKKCEEILKEYEKSL